MDPQQAAEDEAAAWAKVWGAEAPQPHPPWSVSRPEGDPLPPIDPGLIRRCCRRFKGRTGIGIDAWHPRHWAWLSDEALSSLADILVVCEELCSWPSQTWQLVLFLAAKPDGGKRPLVLFATLYRVWECCRAQIWEEWDATH